jgi:hypothetical protein
VTALGDFALGCCEVQQPVTFLSVLRTCKKHIKPVTDLFWISADGNEEIQHGQFDDQRQLIHRVIGASKSS